MKILISFRDLINKAIEHLVIVMLALMVLVISYQVFARVILNAAPTWAESFGIFLFIWVGIFGIAYGFKERTHISVDIFYSYLPESIKPFIRIFNSILVIAVGGFFLLYGLNFAFASMGSNLPGLNIPTGIRYLVVPIAGALMLFYGLISLINKEEQAGGDILAKKEE
ncbi:TRAP transporter small permease [Alkalicoccobacillus porphyridii]|uniref:TRAP transporter small permease n=1 Tax=Alkalicoccobacillus porphyridii TaxID=2597270 RepID=A0A554A0P6_9BACI|nr:TRAP transporter small permease [Alkalicoccobacillus porphyridii]TSB47269.1 TRAP transporter small permease [Alkalicoccobacillus porphyridii]